MKFKIINKKKFIKTIIIIFIIIISILVCMSNKSLSRGNIKYKTIYVMNGDTLWSIAENEQKNNSYYKGKDVRYIISSIKNANNLKNSYLAEGQEILIANI